MINVKGLSFGFPAKDLFNDVGFSLEAGQHCALIGSNGTGKSTLVDIIMNPDKYVFDGEIVRDENCRIGYAGQFNIREKEEECTVFQYLCQRFEENQEKINAACEKMVDEEELETAFEEYQRLLDLHEAMDGDNYESNIYKQLGIANLDQLEELKLSQVSGGEYKILQIMREMLLSPNLLILDEPDVFLDFGNLNILSQLINAYRGTLLVVTHNRYLLNHCFDKIINLENCNAMEYEGNYSAYRCFLLQEKLRNKLQIEEEDDEIARTEEMVDILRKKATILVNPVMGRSVNAKQSQLDRLKARRTESPFADVRKPEIILPDVHCEEGTTVLKVTDYNVEFNKPLLQDVNFELLAGEKVALVGANGTGKTTLLRHIIEDNHPAVKINDNITCACITQLQGENTDGSRTVYEYMQDAGLGTGEEIREYLSAYCFEEDTLKEKLCQLSLGELNLLQIAVLANSKADLLILDEPTSQLDVYAQAAFEKAVEQYRGTVLMVSHDFYLVADCADYVLLAENNTIRRMRGRTFRKMVYDRYFNSEYLEEDRKKQELEQNIEAALKKNDFASAEKLCGQLWEIAQH